MSGRFYRIFGENQIQIYYYLLLVLIEIWKYFFNVTQSKPLFESYINDKKIKEITYGILLVFPKTTSTPIQVPSEGDLGVPFFIWESGDIYRQSPV